MMEPTMEPIGIGEQISGTDVIEDLAIRLVDGLKGNCHLRAIDAYSGYGATMTIELQLHDIDPVRIEKTITIGEVDPAMPSHRIAVEVPLVSAREILEQSGLATPSLERPVDGSTPPEPVARRRFYAPRNRHDVTG